ncbi:conserved hypothetical protein [Candidatus Sulfopaludibacter sp. SbA3]|nr:conserved hypothetical protein [Candidatus Sulfopaludibacter sp. SbA3]
MRVKIYIEGGGDSAYLDERFREGWTAFFERAGLDNRMPRPVRGKGRTQTFDLYRTPVRNRRPDELPLLLVDSESLPAQECSPWQHLKARPEDNWDKPEGAGDDDAFLMICCMETWFIADRVALQRFFGQHWRENGIPKWETLEAISKEQVLKALNSASVVDPVDTRRVHPRSSCLPRSILQRSRKGARPQQSY